MSPKPERSELSHTQDPNAQTRPDPPKTRKYRSRTEDVTQNVDQELIRQLIAEEAKFESGETNNIDQNLLRDIIEREREQADGYTPTEPVEQDMRSLTYHARSEEEEEIPSHETKGEHNVSQDVLAAPTPFHTSLLDEPTPQEPVSTPLLPSKEKTSHRTDVHEAKAVSAALDPEPVEEEIPHREAFREEEEISRREASHEEIPHTNSDQEEFSTSDSELIVEEASQSPQPPRLTRFTTMRILIGFLLVLFVILLIRLIL